MFLKNKLMISAMAVVIGMTTVSCKTVPKANHINTRSDAQCTTTTTTTTATTELRTMTTETTMTSTSTETETEVTDAVIETVAIETTCGGDIYHTEPLSGYWDMTYYSATALGHTAPPCGASGNQLISGYSVASDYFDFGTLLYIESEYMNGTFRVDDCGVGSYNTIDFYFYDNSEVPCDLSQAGRVPITITVIN